MEYLLPSDLVANSNLGVKFAIVDALRCIGTSKEYLKCKNVGFCHPYGNTLKGNLLKVTNALYPPCPKLPRFISYFQKNSGRLRR